MAHDDHANDQGRSADPIKPSRAQVPAQYLGYSLQAARFLQVLLQSPPCASVSLEVFEDVGQELPSGERLASQVKSAMRSNPIADRSVELWKTLRNWVVAIQAGQLDVGKTVFEIYVAGPKAGNLAAQFSAAQTVAEAERALADARGALWGAPPKYPLRRNLPEELKAHCEVVFNADATLLTEMLCRFRIVCGSGDPYADIREQLASKFVPKEILELVLDHALGWVKRTTDSLIRGGCAAICTVDSFNSELTAFVTKCSLRHILVSFARDPSPEAVAADLIRTYVRQLDLIKSDEDDKLRAINDYLRASVDRTEWSRAGLVHESSLDEFADALITFWRNQRKHNDLTHDGLDEVKRGQLLYADCSQHRPHLEGLEVPDYFTPGSFHALADIEDVGWHPNYREQLKAPRESDPESDTI